MADPRKLLSAAKCVLLVDWPDPGVPRALIGAGLRVLSHLQDGCYTARLEPAPPRAPDAQTVFAPAAGETGYLVFEKLDGAPAGVDVACVYRPRKELPEIIAGYVLPCAAKALWLQKPITSEEARRLAAEHGLAFVEGVDIAEVARSLPPPKVLVGTVG